MEAAGICASDSNRIFFPVLSNVSIPAEMVHYALTEGGTAVQIISIGPLEITYIIHKSIREKINGGCFKLKKEKLCATQQTATFCPQAGSAEKQ